MPIYEYRCEACGHEFEEIQRITAPPLETCPACGRPSVHRLISHSSFILKGSGWYVTDYARKGASAPDGGGSAAAGESKSSGAAQPAAGSSSASSSSSSSSSGASGESKPAAAAAG
ncbi:MAG: zinc ribbon domain-containing protein [Myxococcales bacterium]|nr:zinc ribbon domain-containing protein [Myxococcales bacterium]